MTDQPTEQFIGTVDVGELQSIRGAIMRMLARHYAEEMELGRYLRELLATRRWSMVRVVPHTNEQGVPSTHVFDVYGIPAL
jgi:hypothetical protein